MANPDRFSEDTITLRNAEIPVRNGKLPQESLRFYPENPRIYSVVWKEEGVVPTQQEIFSALSKADHVRETLVPSIKLHGGLIEPLLVRGNVVLEGNSRLAAYRLLAKIDAEKWKWVRVRILPETISDSEIFSLLGEYHIKGKKDWAPFEQAGYLYRRFKTDGVTEDVLHAELGLKKSEIRHLIKVYSFMVERDDRNPARWSYYDELLRGRRFNKARELYPKFDEIVVEKIETEEIEKAVDLRNNLPLIVRAGGKTLKKFIDGKIDFNAAVEEARHKGASNTCVKKIQEFRRWLSGQALDEDISESTDDQRHILKFELGKIETRIASLKRRLS